MLLAVLMVSLQLTTVRIKTKAAGVSSGIDLNSTTGWTQVYPANAQNDLQGDQQTGGSTNSVSQDIVGDASNPSTYMKFSDDKTELAIRIRVNNCNGTAASPQFNNFAFVGIDANGNGTIDFFLGIYNPTGNNGRLGIYNADASALNAGPSTTGISGKPLMSFAPVKDVNYSIMQAGSNIFNDPDYFITYKFDISDISDAIAGKTKENVTFNAGTPFRFITGTASQDNSFNQDISGMDKNGWSSGETWAELNVFSPVVSVNGGTYYAVTFDKNTGDTDASPAVEIIQGSNPLGALPATNPSMSGMYFQEWNTSADGTGAVVNPSTVVNQDFTAYAIWSSKPLYTVTFQGNGGSFSDGTTVKTIPTINGVIGDNMPANPTKSGSYFIGWGTDTTFNKSTLYDSQTAITANTTLYALWSTSSTYTAAFYNNIGADGGQVIATIYPNPSCQIPASSLPSPTRSGYTFSGWYDNMNCTGTAFTGGSKISSNMSYYAKWTPATYTLTYNGNGGTISSPSSVSVTNGKFIVPAAPTRSGYIFIEWNLMSDGSGQPMYSTSDISANTMVYAIWQQNVAVTFDANGGTFDIGAPTTIVVKNNKLTALPVPPSRDGYTFLGWGTSPLSTSLVDLTGNFSSSVTLYAVWSPVYTVTFNSNGGAWDGNGTQANVLTAYGNVLYLPESPTRNGYTFAGWNTAGDGSGAAFNAGTDVNGNIPVYAIWTINSYTLSFDSQGGSAVGSQSVNYNGKALKPADPAMTGYSFGGWYKDPGCTNAWDFDNDVVTAATTLYAKWTINSYTVSFDSQGGSAVGNQSINYNGKALKPADPTMTGYSFGGWYKDAGCTNAWDFGNDVVTATTTLYAKWVINSYTVSFDSQGGSAVGNESINYNGKVLKPADPTMTGYSFGGWFREASCTNVWDFNNDVVTAATTLYAKWNQNGYSVTFNSNGGTNVPSANVTSGNTVTKPDDPTKTGYSFGGWYKDAGCTNPWDFDNDVVTAATTLYAKWTINSYFIIFNAQGGSFVENEIIDYGANIIKPDDPTMTGFSFKGWYKEASCTNAWNFYSDTVTADTTLYAKWVINSYTVSFDSQGGNAVGNESIYYNGKVLKPSDPTMTGYSFGGWYKDAGCTNPWDFNNDTVTADTTLYAKWNINSCTLSFDSQGGSAVGNESINYNGKAAKPADPTMTGYSFGGWFKEASCTNPWDFNNDVVTSNTTLYAKWILNSYFVSFNTQGGSLIGNEIIDYGTKVAKPADPTMTGYSFSGWYKDAGCTNAWDFNLDIVTGNTTLYAKWVINSYTLSFDSQGGSAVGNESINYNGKAAKPADPTMTGYSFGGWFKDAGCTNAWDFNLDIVTGNTTLYAKWVINSYTLSFDSQGGSAVGNESINYNGKAAKPADPTMTGYSFGGWFKEASCTNPWDFNNDVVTSNTTLYAKWILNSYFVSFNTQGGSLIGNEIIDYGTKVAKPADPTMTGYSFSGWYKDAGCTNAWDFNLDIVTGNTTLYAKWVINSYAVSFDSQGGSAVGNESINYNGKALKPSDPTMTGYSFGGWFKEASCINAWDFNNDVVTSNTTLYAKWVINSYTLSFDSQGGSAVGNQSINYNGKAAKPEDPTRTGYSFGGWYKDAECTSVWDFANDTVTADTTLYAKWNIDSYTVDGYVKDDSDSELPVPEAKVSVELAGIVISGPVYTDSNGNFELYGVPAGTYDLVIESTDINGNKVIITQVINVTGDIQVGTVKIPLGRKSSIFVNKDDVPVNVVGRLNEVFDNVGSNTDDDLGVTVSDLDCVNNGGETVVRLEANSVDENTQANQISDIESEINRNNKYLGYLVDLSVYKYVTPLNGTTKTTRLKELNNLVDIYISLPDEMRGKKGYAVYRFHEGKIDKITETPNDRGERIEVKGNTIILTVQKFSVYAIAYDKQNTNTVGNDAAILPQTGSVVDFKTLMVTGSLLSLAGIILLRRKKEHRTSEKADDK